MLKINNYTTPSPEQMIAIIRGMRNPLNSWDKSDSYITYIENPETMNTAPFQFILGEADEQLMRKLANAGSDHRKFMRMMYVIFDVTAPRYWYHEADTYKVSTVKNSCSTMHTITKRDFSLDDFSIDDTEYILLDYIYEIVDNLNGIRDLYINYDIIKEPTVDKQAVWKSLIQLLPQSYNQTATYSMSYETLRNIYHSRKSHKLSEWHTFCEWLTTLPYSFLITGDSE